MSPATTTPARLPHEWDDDACCTYCGIDGAEIWHLSKFCGYEPVDSDRWCDERERQARNASLKGTTP